MENENIIIKESEGLKYLQFKKLLELGILHAYTLKGDDTDFTFKREFSESSYNRLCKALNITREQILVPNQTHTDNIVCVEEETEESDFNEVDGLITDKKDIVLATRNADCILFLLYDPVKKVIANVHSGWRGTFKKIVQKTAVKMVTNYGCKAEDILCFISPSIRKCHFEVDEDVKDLCSGIFEFTGRTEEFIEKGHVIDGTQKYLIDTVLINRILLEDVGLKSENIIDSGLCSVCHKENINSARAEGKEFKRAIAVIKL